MNWILMVVSLMFLASFRLQESNRDPGSGILTQDYGIITPSDIRQNAAHAHAVDSKNPGVPFLVWQCLPLENASLECEHLSYDDEQDRYTCSPTLRVVVDGHHLQFDVRHLYDFDDYNYMEQEIHAVLDGEDVGCFSGYYDWDEPAEPPFSRYSLWTLDRIKSRRGEWSYFTSVK